MPPKSAGATTARLLWIQTLYDKEESLLHTVLVLLFSDAAGLKSYQEARRGFCRKNPRDATQARLQRPCNHAVSIPRHYQCCTNTTTCKGSRAGEEGIILLLGEQTNKYAQEVAARIARITSVSDPGMTRAENLFWCKHCQDKATVMAR
jgi:hypothetical protein